MQSKPKTQKTRPAPHPGKRLLARLLAVSLATAPLTSHSADLNTEMQEMFNDMGVLGNVTTPGAFRGQAMNLYTGGSLMMRTPGRSSGRSPRNVQASVNMSRGPTSQFMRSDRPSVRWSVSSSPMRP